MNNQYFKIANFEIPIELKELYQEISKEFEKSVPHAIQTTTKKEEENEKAKKVS